MGMDLKGGSLLNEGNVPFTLTPEECCSLCRKTEGVIPHECPYSLVLDA